MIEISAIPSQMVRVHPSQVVEAALWILQRVEASEPIRQTITQAAAMWATEYQLDTLNGRMPEFDCTVLSLSAADTLLFKLTYGA
jgi:hypothetical protein